MENIFEDVYSKVGCNNFSFGKRFFVKRKLDAKKAVIFVTYDGLN